MDCEPNKSAFVPPLSTVSNGDFLKQIQTVTLLGRAVETVTVNQVQQLIEGSYNQTAWLFEQMDNGIDHTCKSVDERLCFPFDVMEYASRTATDNWRAFMGMETTAELELTKQIETQNQKFSHIETQLKKQVEELTRRASEKEDKLLKQKSEAEKEKKAKQSVQRSQRKLKAAFEVSQEEVVKLKAEIEVSAERYDQQVSENTLLKTQIKKAALDLAEVRKEALQNKSEAAPLIEKIEAMTAEHEKLIAEKDGLNKRIEELLLQLEQSSNYTE